jgi:polyisoprenoid-binding protein YceI
MRILLAAALLTALPAAASDHVLALDPAKAHVGFLLGATGHDVEGTFPLTRCEVAFDPATGVASGEIALDAAHAETGNAKRDKTMREKVLLTADHPSIVFHPQHFKGKLPDSGKAEVVLEGTCNIAGADHPLTMPATIERTGDVVHLSTTFPVPFVDWGMKDPSVMFLKVDKSVQLTIEGDAALDAGAPAVAPAAQKAPAQAAGAGR